MADPLTGRDSIAGEVLPTMTLVNLTLPLRTSTKLSASTPGVKKATTAEALCIKHRVG